MEEIDENPFPTFVIEDGSSPSLEVKWDGCHGKGQRGPKCVRCVNRCVIWHESKLERMEMERIIIKDTRVFKRVSNIFIELFGFVEKI